MSKKGLSELITTVLIIGFTIVLAAVVMTWGGNFVRTLTQQQAETTTTATSCLQMNFDVADINYDGTLKKVNFKVTNNADNEIAGFIALLDHGDTGTDSLGEVTCSVGSFATIPCEISTEVSTDNKFADKDNLKLIPQVEGTDGLKGCSADSAITKLISGTLTTP